MKKIIFSLCCLIILSGCTSTVFQNDADIVRHKHIKYYSEILKEYNEKTGKYPFTGSPENKQTYVFIANSMQKKYIQNPPFEINKKSVREFFTEIENTLGKPIKEYYDPQYFPDNKPAFYMYMTQGNNFYLAVHVSKNYPYAKKIGNGYYKIEVTNDKYSQSTKLIEIEELLKNSSFKEECNKTPNKDGFFKERENKFIRESREY